MNGRIDEIIGYWDEEEEENQRLSFNLRNIEASESVSYGLAEVPMAKGQIIQLEPESQLIPSRLENIEHIVRDILDRMVEVENLLTQQNQLLKQVSEMIVTHEDEMEETDEVEEVQEVDDERAKEMIIQYMREHQESWPQDISRDLRLDFAQVMRITRALLNEGVLETDDAER